MRSLQVRLPVLAVATVAVSLVLSALLVFEVLLLSGERRLDDHLDQEARRVRDWLVRTAPGALGTTDDPPDVADLADAAEQYLAVHDRSDTHMTVFRIGDRLLSTSDAPSSLEVLRDEGALPAPRTLEDDTVATVEGDVRVHPVALRSSADVETGAFVLGSLDVVRGDAFDALRQLLLTAGIGLVVAGGLLALALRRALRPLQELATAAKTANIEQLGQRVELRNEGDEVSVLANEFNRMLDRLERSVADQQAFMATVSHELRTPITIARGHLEVLRSARDTLDEEAVDETVALVRDELLRMQRLVEDLLILTGADAPDFVVARQTSLREFFDELHLRVAGLGIPHVVFEPVPDTTFCADGDRLAQALLNLITNAHVHSSGLARIEVGADVDDDESLRLHVVDDGPGIDRSVQDRLFEPFARSDSATRSTGLGLSVVRAVIDAHGGEVQVVSGPNGTSVTLVLHPRTEADPAETVGGDEPAPADLLPRTDPAHDQPVPPRASARHG
ncbi:MAG: HAMP domain-containing sensor histidine kinase [Actinomycetota bacterium]|nr:HAMP domain-containing sensor histidine kinase [Actinomycetota bacterium]